MGKVMYIDEKYSSEANKNHEGEKAYFSFVLGYDILQDMFKNSTVQECDCIYDFCNYEADKFLKSNEYLNPKYSSYEMLIEWVVKNKETILEDYLEMTGGEPKLYNGNMRIIDKGFRKDEPIALVEKNVPSVNRKEYIVAFNYTIDKENNNLSWGYGRYYYDRGSGEEAYKKVINGGNLSYSFDKEHGR